MMALVLLKNSAMATSAITVNNASHLAAASPGQRTLMDGQYIFENLERLMA